MITTSLQKSNLITSRPQNIWGIGRNFKDHATEMKAPIPDSPIVFLKSGATLNQGSEIIQLPAWTTEVHHEVELAVQISESGIPLQAAISLDLTERDCQAKAKAKGLPWTLAKSFHGATVLGAWHNWNPCFLESKISLQVNGVTKQSGNMIDLIFDFQTISEYLVKHFPVCHGDIILLGTPSGIGPIVHGDRLLAKLENYFSQEWLVNK